MAFNSFSFCLIFPLIFALYWIIPANWNKGRKVFLVVVSYLLYMNWKPAYAMVLLGVTLVTYWGGHLLELGVETEEINIGKKKRKQKKALAWCFALLALLPLLVFKYYNFLNDSISSGLVSIGLSFSLPGLNWAIPVGISFFTFQAVGYMLDVYHGRVNAEKNLLDYVLFVSFFPQVTSGPISKAEELLPQIKAVHKFDYKQGVLGLKWLLWGMFIKVVIADRVGMLVDTVYGNYQYYSGNALFLASVFYTIQIYCDFAGYSLMAIGIAKTIGFELVNNFRQPYLAKSVTDFWKRWHISLTRWLTTHVYIALGGSRCSKRLQFWNILVTFLVSGLWHGANWTFVFWGFLHGVFQIVEKVMGLDPKGRFADSKLLMYLTPLRMLVTFMLVNLAWIFFRMPTIGDAFDVIGKIMTDRGAVDLITIYNGSAPVLIVSLGLAMLIIHDLLCEYGYGKVRLIQHPIFKWVMCVLLFILIISVGILDGG